ncbi:MAG: hypothetical protein FWD11_11935 [Micrococcales bacterium]|nr:hypothetical protein [Micrococcales bacterium]
MSVAAHEPNLRLAYAQARLADAERMRQVYLAALDGVPQRDIARAIHLSQASVHRTVAKARVLGAEHESVEEIVLRRFTGQLTTQQMLTMLAGYERWVPRVVHPVDGVLPGDTQEQLEDLLDDGFLTEDELDQVLDARA